MTKARIKKTDQYQIYPIMENKYKNGDVVFESIHPNQRLIIQGYARGVYHCATQEDSSRNGLVYYERELKPYLHENESESHTSSTKSNMLPYSIIFLLIAMVAVFIGFSSEDEMIASVAMIIFYIFLVLFAFAFVLGGFVYRRNHKDENRKVI